MTPEQELQQLRDRVQTLEDENEELRDAIGWWELRPAIVLVLGLLPAEAAIVAALVRREICSYEQLLVLAYSARNINIRPDLKVLHVHMSHLRPKLRQFDIEIETIKSIGYSLRAPQRRRLLTILRDNVARYMALQRPAPARA